MENVVSARRLRKSMLNSIDVNTNYTYEKNKESNDKITIKNKIFIQSLISSIILFVTIFVVKNYSNVLMSNKIISRLYEHYKFDFSKELILNNFEEGVKNINRVMGDIVPDKIKSGIVNIYNNKIKYFIITFNIKDLLKSNKNQVGIYLYDEEFKSLEDDIIENNVSYDSSKSLSDISLIKPTVGTVTSGFGEREKIFEELSSNHTGIDIANDIGTDILSSSSGIVSKIEYDDKYYGNYIEITEGDVVFKYAHLSDILVKENDYIVQGQIIAKMGNTGMSTGSHLHFEIKENGEFIDPVSVMDF